MNLKNIWIGWCLFGCASALPAAPPRLEIEPAGRIDLGELGPLEPAEQRYRFRNLSAGPIALRVYDLSPGVSVAGPALDRPIPGGATAALVLRVDPSDWVGAQKRNVRLGTDDPRQGDYYLPVSRTVRPDLTVDRLRGSFGDVAAGSRPQVEFRFARETLKPLWLRVANPLPEYLDCEVLPEGPNCRLVCRFRPDQVEPGMRLGLERIRVESNAPLQPRFDLYLDWRLHHPVEAAPSRLVFADPRPDALQLKVRARDGTPFRILAAELEGDGFRLGGLPAAAAAEQVLSVRRVAPEPARAVLVLRFSGVAEPLKVPVAYLPSQVPDRGGAKLEPDPNP
jgi:hypothetical protein